MPGPELAVALMPLLAVGFLPVVKAQGVTSKMAMTSRCLCALPSLSTSQEHGAPRGGVKGELKQINSHLSCPAHLRFSNLGGNTGPGHVSVWRVFPTFSLASKACGTPSQEA